MKGPNPLDSLMEESLAPITVYTARARQSLAARKNGKSEGLDTGLDTLRNHFRLFPAELTLIVARPSMGKTILLMQFAQALARNCNATDVIPIFSAEMTGEQLANRMACAIAAVDSQDLRFGRETDEQRGRFLDALDSLDRSGMWIDQSAAPSTAHMLEQLHQLLEAGLTPRALFFDYVELAGDRARNSSAEQRISEIAINLKAIAKRLQIPVVAAAQISREVEATASKLPQLPHLRMSGMLEQAADNVLGIMRPSYYLERGQGCACELEEDRANVAYLGILKQRNGEAGIWLRLGFSPTHGRFADLTLVKRNVDSFNVRNP